MSAREAQMESSSCMPRWRVSSSSVACTAGGHPGRHDHHDHRQIGCVDRHCLHLRRPHGEVRLGDGATLSVDSFPDETFTATVTRIADQAEYTPRNVQTKEERQTTVYAVELSVENLMANSAWHARRCILFACK